MKCRLRILVVAPFLVAPLGCGGSAVPALQANTAPKPVPVKVAPVEMRTVERTVSLVGTLRGWNEVTVGSKRMGRVAKVFHDIGDRLEPGEVIVAMETIDSDLSMKQAEKKLQAEVAKLGLTEMPTKDFDVRKVPSVVQSRVALERAEQNLAREKSLNQRRAGSLQDFQNAENDLKSAEAALENAVVTARSTLASAQAAKVACDQAIQTRADMEIRAPVPSGSNRDHERQIVYAVSKRNVSEGQMIKEGDAVAELVVENPLKLWANVPERFSADITVGQPVRINVTAHPGRVFDGKVTRINPAIDASSRTFQVEAGVPNDQGLLKPGGFAKASILTHGDSQAKIVPLESVVKYAGVSKLFVVDQGQAREVKVETGLQGPGWVEVIGPVSESAQVVTEGQTQLANGTPVIVRKRDAQAEAPVPVAAAPRSPSL